MSGRISRRVETFSFSAGWAAAFFVDVESQEGLKQH